MKNMNLILVIFLSLVLAVVVYNRVSQKFVAPKPPVSNLEDELLTVPDKEPVAEEPKTEEIKIELLAEAKSYSDALKMAKEHKRPMFLYFGAPWCHWCEQMRTGTLSDSEVKNKLAKEFVVYFVNTDKHKQLARKYRISGIPVSMIVNEDEKEVAKHSGAMSKQEFMDFLNEKPKDSHEASKTSLIENNFDEKE